MLLVLSLLGIVAFALLALPFSSNWRRVNLQAMPEGTLSEHSKLIALYAVCGFAALASCMCGAVVGIVTFF